MNIIPEHEEFHDQCLRRIRVILRAIRHWELVIEDLNLSSSLASEAYYRDCLTEESWQIIKNENVRKLKWVVDRVCVLADRLAEYTNRFGDDAVIDDSQ